MYIQAIPTISLPKWSELPSIIISDNSERLIPTSLNKQIFTFPIYSKIGLPGAINECYVRESVFLKLLEVNKRLPKGFNLVMLDGWRSTQVQKYLFKNILIDIKSKSDENITDGEIYTAARALVAPPSEDPLNPSPHNTGGSVDVTLCDDNGCMIEMGSDFDENSPLSSSSAYESETDSPARKHRRILYNAMIYAGFTNLPSEWWHYDYGNQIWGYYKKQSTAIYGGIESITFDKL
ncbi:M15 family metallopeptidase [Psychromonas sp. SA13A]|uniref:M15 family metallopeptidase n=1 Tax=Psychromonas sp. SA13A TaxID=2686346 RepID=UPI00140942AC|nr:M15 family metallopeptidase [Psychromonas sp. SA13A]